MNKNEIKQDLTLLKEKLHTSFNEIAHISLPHFILNQKLFSSGNELLLNKFNLYRSEIDVLSSL